MPFQDAYVKQFLAEEELELIPVMDTELDLTAVDLVVAATPSNYDEAMNSFDTQAVESVIEKVREQNSDARVVVKSSIPVGFTQNMIKK